jgi:O-antigen/teichoic acid export membrane protein
LSLPNQFGGYGTYARLGYYYNAIALNSSLRNKFRKIWQSEFFRNAATLATGTTVAQGISIFTAPILYRIYDREDYGTLGLYMAITGVVGVFSTMQYLQVILLEKEDADAKAAMWLNRVINFGVALVIGVITILLNKPLSHFLNSPSISYWLYLCPVSIFFSGQNAIFRTWANRKKYYKILSTNTILMAVIVPAISLTYGIAIGGFATGLFLGLLASHIIPPLILFFRLSKRDNLGFIFWNWVTVKQLAIKHLNFPKYSLPANFVSNFSHQLPIFIFSRFEGPALVGLYNLSNRMLGIPSNLIASSIGEVYRQKASQDYNEKGTFKTIYLQTLKIVTLIAIPTFGLIALTGPVLFAFIFGEEWREAGRISQIMSLVFGLRFINAPLSYAIFIKGKQKIDLIASLWFVLSSAAVLYVGFLVSDNYIIPISLFALNFALIYLIMMIYTFKLSTQ